MDNNQVFIKDGDYYIHYHHSKIGNLAPGRSLNWGSLISQARADIIGQYSSFLSDNLKIKSSPASIDLIAKTMNLKSEDLITQLDNDIKKQLQSTLNVNKLQSLLDTTKDLGTLVSSVGDSGQKENLKDLEDLFNILKKSIELIEGPQAKQLAACLSLQNFDSYASASEQLTAALKKWENSNLGKIKKIKKEALLDVHQKLESLAYALKNKSFKSTGNALTSKGLSVLISNNLVSTSLAEGLAFMMDTSSKRAIGETTDSFLKGAGISVQGYNQLKDDNRKSVTSKTDIKLSNVKYTIEANGQKQNITLNIGISSKFYRGLGFLGGSDVGDNIKGDISTGSGGTLKEALNMIFFNDIDKYLAYNYAFWSDPNMTQLLTTRLLVRLISSMSNSKDFSQYLLINGKIVSVWDIIRYAQTAVFNKSLSQRDNMGQGIYITIPSRKDDAWIKEGAWSGINGVPDEQEAWNRSKKINAIINSSVIKGTIRLDELANGFIKNNLTI